MNKNDKKIKVLTTRIAQLEDDMKAALQKKRSLTSPQGQAIDVPGTLKKIANLKADLQKLM